MANVTTKTILKGASLDPGKTGHWWWNNAHYGKIYVFEVVPLDAGSTQTGYNHVYQAQITKQWRKFRTWEEEGSIGVKVKAELELHYHVKNIGSKKLRFNVKMATIG